MIGIRAAGLVRPLAACLLIGALAACGQNQQPVARAPISNGDWARPNSYNPPGPPHDPWGPWISQASRRFDVPERWIREVMRQESAGRVSATSRVGAMGLLQVMPGTYRELQARYGLGSDPYHPWDNLMAGTAYIREMYELYGSPGFLAAYNGGPRRLEDYLWGNRGLPDETRNYVARIGPRIAGVHPVRRAPPEVYAAAELPLNIPRGPRQGDAATMLALREQRRAVDPGIQVAQLPAGPVRSMEPIPDGSTGGGMFASTASAAVASAAAGAPPRTQVASLGGAASAGSLGGGVVAMAPVASLGDFQTRMEPIESPGDRAPASATRMEPIVSPGDRPAGTALASVSMEPIVSPGDRMAVADVARMDPVVSPGDPGTIQAEPLAPAAAPGFFTPPAARAPAPVQAAPAARPGTPAARPAAPTALAAAAPAPGRPGAPPAGRPAAPVARVTTAPVAMAAAPSLVPAARAGTAPMQLAAAPAPASRGFGFMPQAQAATMPTPPRPAAPPAGGGAWGIQVGAFASENLARAAAGQARDSVGASGTRAQVEAAAQQGRSTLYRARVTGLASRSAAEQACERMRGRGVCMVVAPGV